MCWLVPKGTMPVRMVSVFNVGIIVGGVLRRIIVLVVQGRWLWPEASVLLGVVHKVTFKTKPSNSI